MAVIKCKMCGGDLDISQGLSVCECEYCGTRQTVPAADAGPELRIGAGCDVSCGIPANDIVTRKRETEIRIREVWS